MSSDSDEYQRQLAQEAGNAVRLAGQMGARAMGPAMVALVDNPAANLLPEAQRNEALLRSARVKTITPAPELQFIYGVLTLVVSMISLITIDPLGVAFFVSAFFNMISYPLTSRFGPVSSRNYVVAVSCVNITLLGLALYRGAPAFPGDWWPASVEVFSVFAFGVYPLLVLRRKRGQLRR